MFYKQELTGNNWCFAGDGGFPGLPGKTERKMFSLLFHRAHKLTDCSFSSHILCPTSSGPPGQMGHTGLDGPRGPKGAAGNVKLKSFNTVLGCCWNHPRQDNMS